jgi:phosphatidylglycerophosphatase A
VICDLFDKLMIMYIKKLKYLIATGIGSGYSPYVPGTVGSLLALLIFILFPLSSFIWLGISTAIFIIGIWASGIVEKDYGKDPRIVVIDEFVGQWIALLFLPRTVWIYAAGFILFRILDIIKPFPANKVEKIHGGTGIMLDDLIAAVYANLALQLVLILMT